MRRAAAALLLLAVACGALAYWGMFTRSGAHHFDEMAGMIPFFAGVASSLLLLGSVAAWVLGNRRG